MDYKVGDDGVMRGVDEQHPVSPLVACMEELQAQIELLDNHFTKQEAEITNLKARVFSLEGGPSR